MTSPPEARHKRHFPERRPDHGGGRQREADVQGAGQQHRGVHRDRLALSRPLHAAAHKHLGKVLRGEYHERGRVVVALAQGDTVILTENYSNGSKISV
jgi:hypothetical protein